jgi:lysophospholipase
MTWINSNARQLKTPCLIVAAGADPIVDPSSNENFASLSQSNYRVVPGALHELLLERDIYRDQFLDAFDSFLKKFKI